MPTMRTMRIFALDLIENPIITHAQAVKFLFALDLLNSLRVRIICARLNAPCYPSPYLTVEGFEVSNRPRRKLYPVRQLDAELSLDLLPRYRALFLHLRERLPRLSRPTAQRLGAKKKPTIAS